MAEVTRYLRSRNVAVLLAAVVGLTALLMSPIGAIRLLPQTLGSTTLDVPVRVVGMALLAAPACLARAPGLEVRELSGVRPLPVLRLAAPLVVATAAFCGVLAAATLVDAAAGPLLRNLALFQGLAWLASRIHPQLGWLAAAATGLACVPLAADAAWWVAPLAPVDARTLALAGLFLAAGITALGSAPAQRHG